MIQELIDLNYDLDVMGRPNDWQNFDNLLNTLLPQISELANIGKGVRLLFLKTFN